MREEKGDNLGNFGFIGLIWLVDLGSLVDSFLS